jgi:superfamily I DNA and/or RNA helicase
VSVANLVGMAPSASNIVLLGDQMQLNQPVQGVHPGESGESVLEYLLQDQATVPDDMGIFLPSTWRMRPELCAFVSSSVYESRLNPEPITSERNIQFGAADRRWLRRNTGLIYIPVEHEGNTYESDEEADVIRQIVAELGQHFIEMPGVPTRLVEPADILVVAPYNLQVRKLKSLIPGARVGTVDKFQGQEAPVVIFSMTASDGNASPRGIEFLFSRNRLNVAISRA